FLSRPRENFEVGIRADGATELSATDCRSNPIAHRVRRKPQRLPPSLLIENASDRDPYSTQRSAPRRFRSRLATIREISPISSRLSPPPGTNTVGHAEYRKGALTGWLIVEAAFLAEHGIFWRFNPGAESRPSPLGVFGSGNGPVRGGMNVAGVPM